MVVRGAAKLQSGDNSWAVEVRYYTVTVSDWKLCVLRKHVDGSAVFNITLILVIHMGSAITPVMVMEVHCFVFHALSSLGPHVRPGKIQFSSGATG